MKSYVDHFLSASHFVVAREFSGPPINGQCTSHRIAVGL